MKKAIFVFFLIAVATSLEAQTVTLGPITKLNYCMGDTLFVPYQSSGVFSSDNTFNVQLSDSNGSFTAFTIVGHTPAMSGSIPVKMNATGSGFRIRVASTDPYVLSHDNGADIGVLEFPSPRINVGRNGGPIPPQNLYLVLGFAGDLFNFIDVTHESSGSTYRWQFDSTASTLESADSAPTISYGAEGFKRVVLTVSNANGCAASTEMDFYVASCTPVIPGNALTVNTTARSGLGQQDPAVWVKAGGAFTQDFDKPNPTVIFAEPGSSVGWSNEVNQPVIYYLKTGTSFKPGGDYCPGVYVILERGNVIPFADTLYCDHLNFDYSKILSTISTCTPTIAGRARIVEGSASGNDSIVWVKSGTYTALGNSTAFVEPGATVVSQGQGTYYVRRGGSLLGTGFVVVADSAATDQCSDCIRFSCSNLTFDYSQVNAGVTQPEASPIIIRQSGNTLYVKGEGNLETRIFNLLGNDVLSKGGAGTLDLDLSTLPAGVYFAIVQSGDVRKIKRIAVVH